MKPFYSIHELADLLNSEVYAVANGLVAAGVPTLHNGKRVDLADYECFRPIYSGENTFVLIGGPPSPNGYTIMVSTDALPAVWVQSIKEAELHDDQDGHECIRSEEKPLQTTERNTLLTIIAALCDYSAIKHQERGAASQIVKMTEEIGAVVSVDTVRRALEKIPDALETRMK
jgi:hypothetical protein